MLSNLQTNVFPITGIPSQFQPTFYQSNFIGYLISVIQIPRLKYWDNFWLNHVLLFLILDVDTQVNKHYFSICNENAPQHTDIVWKGLVLQTRTWKWTAVILFAISCISNSSSKSNNSSNNVITAINNRVISTTLSYKGRDRHWSKLNEKWRYRQTGLSNAARQTIGWKKYKLPADSKRPAFF